MDVSSVPLSDGPSFDTIVWDPDERAWIHLPLDMGSLPKINTFYAYVGDSVEDTRSLIYHIDGEGLALTREVRFVR